MFPSLMDWLDPKVPVEWLAEFLDLIHTTPNLDWLLLTKRPELFFDRLPSADWVRRMDWVLRWMNGATPANVWLGVSVEDQERAEERIPELLKIPARVRFLSCEPLLQPIDLGMWITKPKNHTMLSLPDLPGFLRPNWVIVGGESGPYRRDCGVDAIVDVARQCRAAGVPCFVKQDCGPQPGQQGRISDQVWSMKTFP